MSRDADGDVHMGDDHGAAPQVNPVSTVAAGKGKQPEVPTLATMDVDASQEASSSNTAKTQDEIAAAPAKATSSWWSFRK